MEKGRCPKCCDWVDLDQSGHCKICGTTVAQNTVYVIESDCVYCLRHGKVSPNTFGGCPECISESILSIFTLAKEGV